MGKIRRERHKYHISAATTARTDSQDVPGSNPNSSSLGPALASLPVTLSSVGVFDNVNIDTNAIVKKLPDFDQCSVRSVLSNAMTDKLGKKLTKKQKRKLRHATFIEKINAIQNAKKSAKDTKKRQKTVIIGDMQPLTDALPIFDTKQCVNSSTKDVTAKPVKKFKARQNEMLKDLEVFRQVLNDPSFQRDPEATIMDHLRNKLLQELE